MKLIEFLLRPSLRGALSAALAMAMVLATLPSDSRAGPLLFIKGRPAASTPATGTPASVNAPVQGSALTAVWNLQFGGTGPQTAPTNGTWPGGTCVKGANTNIPDYLNNIGGPFGGFLWGNDCSLFLNVGSANLIVANYNFANSPNINVSGTGTVTFQDDTMPNPGDGTGIAGSRNINANPDGLALTVVVNNGLMNVTTFFSDAGATFHFDHTRWTGQVQQLGGANGSVWIDWGFITGGGLNPVTFPTLAHVEELQFNGTSPAFLTVSNTISNANGEGQANIPIPAANAGWTSVWTTTSGNGAITLQNYIGIGVTELDGSSIRANRVGGTLAYSEVTPATITNSILEQAHGAPGGYSNNGNNGSSVGSASGTTLTVSLLNSGSLVPGQVLSGAGVTLGTILGSQISGTAGGAGTYNISPAQTFSSQTVAMTGHKPTISGNRTFGNAPLTTPDFNFMPVFGLLAIRRRRAAANDNSAVRHLKAA